MGPNVLLSWVVQYNVDLAALLLCLNQFRVLITEIGNALGYVRMVRSAGTYGIPVWMRHA